MPETVYSIAEVAKMLKVSEHTVRTLINRRELEAFKVGGQLRIREDVLERYMKRKQP